MLQLVSLRMKDMRRNELSWAWDKELVVAGRRRHYFFLLEPLTYISQAVHSIERVLLVFSFENTNKMDGTADARARIVCVQGTPQRLFGKRMLCSRVSTEKRQS